MQIVIDIPKVMYINAKRDLLFGADILVNAIKNGTPLPKEHGRLIDAGEFVEVLNNAQIEGLNTYKGLGRAKELLIESPTIIEADTESEG